MDMLAGKKSADLFRRACRVLPGGVSRNTLLHGDCPHYVMHGKGCRVTDVEGVERLDFANNVASLIHGHAFAPIVAAVGEQLTKGTAFTMATREEILFAEAMCERSENFDKIRFMNSGTEAVMAGMKAARAYTDRPKIAKVEGSYHGAYDYAEVSQGAGPENWGDAKHPTSVPLAVGTPEGVLDDVIVIPFNDVGTAIDILSGQAADIAAILIDPVPHRVGMAPVSPDFVCTLATWAQANGSLLIFDEVITFRTEFGGAQERYDVAPDLTAMGKMIGGGFPVGALAGRDEVMGVFTSGPKGLRLPHSGTFSANPITMTAGRVAMEHFDLAAVARLNALGDRARGGIVEAIKVADVPASVTGAGSMFRIHIKPSVPVNYRKAHLSPQERQVMTAFISAMYDEGIMMVHTAAGILSTPMTGTEIDQLSDAVLNAFRRVKPLWPDTL